MEEKIFEMLNSEEYIDLASYYEHQTFLGILGVSRKEFAHSNFLHWIFSPTSNHGLGDYAIRKLLEICYNYLSNDLKNVVAKGNYKISNIEVSREFPIDSFGFIDLFASLNISDNSSYTKPLNIIVENKVESSENENQTLKYQQWYESSNLKNEEVLMLYFTPKQDDKISSDKFIKVTYNDLSNRLLKYCLNAASNVNIKYLISDYMCCLSQPLINQIDDDNIDNTERSILAVNDGEKVMVNHLLEKYNNEITYIIDNLTNTKDSFINGVYQSRVTTLKGIFTVMLDVTTDNDLISKLNRILFNRISKIEFNNKTYQPYGRKRNSIGYLVRDMIDLYASNNSITLSSMKELLASKVWLSPWKGEIITNNVPKRPDHFFMKEEEKVVLSDCSVYVARYWITDDALEMANLLELEIKELSK